MSEEKLKKIWKEVELKRSNFSKDFVYKNFYEGKKKDLILLGIDKDLSKGILIKDETGRSSLPKLSSSFQIKRDYVEEENSSFIIIFCKEKTLDDTFTYLTRLIIKNIDDSLSPTLATKEAIEQVKKIFQSLGKLPPESEIVGLIGELFFIDQVTKLRSNLWKGWSGPEDKIVDFSFGKIDVEIKSSSYSGEDKITINNLKQLEYIKNRSRYLLYSRFIKDPEGDLSVPDLIDNIFSQIDDKDSFRAKKLSLTKYKIQDKDLWLERRYSYLDTRIYKVEEKFPRINSESFKNDKIPDGINKITYDLALNTVSEFEVEKNHLFNQFL